MAEAARKDHLFLPGPGPRVERLNTGEEPPGNLQRGPIPSFRDIRVCHQCLQRSQQLDWLQLPPTLLWAHPGFRSREAQLHFHSLWGRPHPQVPRAAGKDSHIYKTEIPWQVWALWMAALRLREKVTCPRSQSSSVAKLAASLITDTFLYSTCILLTARGPAPRGRGLNFLSPLEPAGPYEAPLSAC